MFATAKCGHCGKMGTKIQTIEPSGARYKQNAVCCFHCNAILGVTDYFNVGTLLKSAEKERKAMLDKIDHLQMQIQQIASALRR